MCNIRMRNRFEDFSDSVERAAQPDSAYGVAPGYDARWFITISRDTTYGARNSIIFALRQIHRVSDENDSAYGFGTRVSYETKKKKKLASPLCWILCVLRGWSYKALEIILRTIIKV